MTTRSNDPLDLETALGARPSVADGGFTARVVAALPPARPRRSRILAGFGVASAALAAGLLAGPARAALDAWGAGGGVPVAALAGVAGLWAAAALAAAPELSG